MEFQIVGQIEEIEVIAVGGSIKEINRLIKIYWNGRWRKLKGIAQVQFDDGISCIAELHWYEAHGIGKKEFKIKHIL